MFTCCPFMCQDFTDGDDSNDEEGFQEKGFEEAQSLDSTSESNGIDNQNLIYAGLCISA